jgi:hypothetical protein
MATQLSLYNGALRALGERKLASLSEDRKPRRLLDDVYTGAVAYCLEQGDWKFAQRASLLAYESSYTAPFGYRRQFQKPTDLVRLSKMCTDEYFQCPLLQYEDNAGFWFADLDEIYVSYVSNDASYGLDLTLWTETFTNFVELYLASQIVDPLLQSDTKTDKIMKLLKAARAEAKSRDSMDGPTEFPPIGSWTRARRGDTATRKNRGSLLG